MPIFGPSSARDTFGLGADSFLDPLFYATGNTSDTLIDPAYLAPYAIKGVDTRADLLGAEKILEVAALDKYTYIRDAYLARRKYLVYDGMPPTEDEDDLFEDDEDFEDEEEEDLESDEVDEGDSSAKKDGLNKDKAVDKGDDEEDFLEEEDEDLEEEENE